MSRRPAGSDQRADPRAAGSARGAGRRADRDQGHERGARSRRTRRTCTSWRSRRTPTRPWPRSWTTASGGMSRSSAQSSPASTSRRSTSRRSSSGRRSGTTTTRPRRVTSTFPQPAREGQGHDHVPGAGNLHPEKGRTLLGASRRSSRSRAGRVAAHPRRPQHGQALGRPRTQESNKMPKMKTRSAAKKRFKVTGPEAPAPARDEQPQPREEVVEA